MLTDDISRRRTQLVAKDGPNPRLQEFCKAVVAQLGAVGPGSCLSLPWAILARHSLSPGPRQQVEEVCLRSLWAVTRGQGFAQLHRLSRSESPCWDLQGFSSSPPMPHRPHRSLLVCCISAVVVSWLLPLILWRFPLVPADTCWPAECW